MARDSARSRELPPNVLPAFLAPNTDGDGFGAPAPVAKGFFTAGALGLGFFAKGLGCDAEFADGVAPNGLRGALLPLFWAPFAAPNGLDEKGDCFCAEEKEFDAKGDAEGCCDQQYATVEQVMTYCLSIPTPSTDGPRALGAGVVTYEYVHPPGTWNTRRWICVSPEVTAAPSPPLVHGPLNRVRSWPNAGLTMGWGGLAGAGGVLSRPCRGRGWCLGASCRSPMLVPGYLSDHNVSTLPRGVDEMGMGKGHLLILNTGVKSPVDNDTGPGPTSRLKARLDRLDLLQHPHPNTKVSSPQKLINLHHNIPLPTPPITLGIHTGMHSVMVACRPGPAAGGLNRIPCLERRASLGETVE